MDGSSCWPREGWMCSGRAVGVGVSDFRPNRRPVPSTGLLQLVKPLLTLRRIEPVADAPDGDQVGGMFWLALDLRAQPADVHVDRPRVTDLVESPDAIQQLAPRERTPWMGSQHRQKLEFFGPQMHGKPVTAQLVGNQVELESVGNLDVARRSGSRLLLEPSSSSGELVRLD